MKRAYFVTVLGFAILQASAYAKSTRVLSLGETDVGEIHTAISYSTILQFDSRPVSVVVGDQDSFKVEYVGNSITLKPVLPGSRTNMFVFTGYDRFSFKVITGRSDSADYFVEVKKKRQKDDERSLGIDVGEFNSPGMDLDPAPSSKMNVQTIGRKTKCGGIQLSIDSISSPKGKPWLVIAFSVTNLRGGGASSEFQGTDIFLTRGKKGMSFETLYLESLKLPSEGAPVHGSILLSNKGARALNGLVLNFAPAILSQNRCRALRLVLKATPKEKKPELKQEEKPHEGNNR